MTRRTTPYTAMGIRRVPCRRCGEPSSHQWQICADGNVYRAVCDRCDADLNALVLRWVGDPDAETKIEAYRRKVMAGS